MVAQPAGALLMFANRNADPLNTNTPPVRPPASRAIQKPNLLRPMKNKGMDSLRALLLGRCGKTVPRAPRVPPLKGKLTIVFSCGLGCARNVTAIA
jgi:hypothetical protein